MSNICTVYLKLKNLFNEDQFSFMVFSLKDRYGVNLEAMC